MLIFWVTQNGSISANLQNPACLFCTALELKLLLRNISGAAGKQIPGDWHGGWCGGIQDAA